MKTLIYILLLCTSFSSFGQAVSKEDFLNDAYTTFIDSAQHTYYLSRGAQSFMPMADNGFKALKKQFTGFIDNAILEPMVSKMIADTADQTWDCPKLHNANCDFANEYNQKNKIITYYRLSFPVFDDKYQYAIMQVMTICGPQCGNICIFLFKKTGNHWTAITSADCAIF